MNTLTTAWRLKDQIASKTRFLMLANTELSYEEAKQSATDDAMIEFREVLRIKTLIDDIMFELKGNLKQTYFITVRPDTKKITFKNFMILCNKYFSRKCFNTFLYSYEQKGTSPETLGQGFHIHIIAEMTFKSKGETLRATQSTFNQCTAPNCVDVSLVKTQKDYENINGYLLNYESKDGHKIITKEWDTLWRQKNNLHDIYNNEFGSLPVSSPVLAGKILLEF